MTCSCHGRKGEETRVVRPYDQCTTCARKHVKNAWGMYHELSHEEDNRDYVSDNLRRAADHLKIDHRETALRCRDLAVAIEENADLLDPSFAVRLADLLRETRDLYYADHPEARGRLDGARGPVPVVIPLGGGSRSNNEELRLLLRSLEANAEDLGEVYLVTTCAPEWVQNVVVVPVGDVYADNKDANLFAKTHEAIRRHGLGVFCWAADDNVLLCRMRLADIPAIHSHRPLSVFQQPDGSKWQRRVKATIEWARTRGVELEHTYECHCLQLFDGQAILRGMEGVSFYPDAKTIYTTWRVVTDTWRDTVDQRQWKETYELPKEPVFEKPLAGYNDAGYPSIRKALFERFPKKSRYEK